MTTFFCLSFSTYPTHLYTNRHSAICLVCLYQGSSSFIISIAKTYGFYWASPENCSVLNHFAVSFTGVCLEYDQRKENKEKK